jgi:hypothetical protein
MRPARLSIARAILAAMLVLSDVAIAVAQSHDPAPAKPAPPPAAAPEKPKPVTPPPDMKTVVERIQKRIEEEVTRPEAARRAATKKPAASKNAAPIAPTADAAHRVRLTWRASLVWPEDLK